ncbi:MAG: hypothetical protein U9N81_02425 [Bacillota bacterium]|nr:hypothetical protein [Bacillota bacterium]
MTVILGIMAAIIFLMYSSYFIHILKGQPQDFEMEILKALAGWMVQQGSSSKMKMWHMFGLSLLIELIYFLLAFIVLANPFMIYLTVAFVGFEAYHYSSLAVSFKHFFSGQTKISDIFNWKTERLSATLFYTHAMLVLISLLFPM